MRTKNIAKIIMIVCVLSALSSYAFADINSYGNVGTTGVHGHLYVNGTTSVAAGTYANQTIRYMNVNVATYDKYHSPITSSSTVPAYNTTGIATSYISKGSSATTAEGHHYADDTYHGGYEWSGTTTYTY